MYNLNAIQTLEECTTILDSFSSLRDTLQLRVTSIERQNRDSLSLAEELPTDKAVTELEISQLQNLTVLAADPVERLKTERDINNLETKLRSINQRLAKYGIDAQIIREEKLAFAQAELDEINELLSALEVRKQELTNSQNSAA
jgi:hypothetical protein